MSNFVRFKVKLAYTHHVREFEFSVNTTIESMLDLIQSRAFGDFHPFLNETMFNSVKVIEAGQYNNVNGFDPELAPPMEPSNTTIREKYGTRYDQVAFYIRPVRL